MIASRSIQSLYMSDTIQPLCQQASDHLVATRYLEAEQLLVRAEAMAWADRDWDALHRLYMPLQECRRQRRQVAMDGAVQLDFVAEAPNQTIDVDRIARDIPRGQVLVAGFGTLAPAEKLRAIAATENLYLDAFLAAAYRIGGQTLIVIVPTPGITLPAPEQMTLDALLRKLPPHTIALPAADLPKGLQKGTTQTAARTMALWEQLHLPFLAAADATVDPIARMAGYRNTLGVDYACELAHQRLSDVARNLLIAQQRSPR